MGYAQDMKPLFTNPIRMPNIAVPTAPVNPTPTLTLILKQLVKRNTEMARNLGTLKAIIWGQCSDTMRSRLRALPMFQANYDDNNCLWFLTNIKSITMQFDAMKSAFISLLDARAHFLNCKQGEDQSNDEYADLMRNWAEAIEYHRGIIAENWELVPDTHADGTAVPLRRTTPWRTL
jgi:hypothetical protein